MLQFEQNSTVSYHYNYKSIIVVRMLGVEIGHLLKEKDLENKITLRKI